MDSNFSDVVEQFQEVLKNVKQEKLKRTTNIEEIVDAVEERVNLDKEDDVYEVKREWDGKPKKIDQIRRNYETGELIKEDDPEPVIKDEDPKKETE